MEKSIAFAPVSFYYRFMDSRQALTNVYIIILLTAAVFVNVLVYAKLTGADEKMKDWKIPAAIAPSKQKPDLGGGKMGPDLYEYSYAGAGQTRARRSHRPYYGRTYGSRCGDCSRINPFYEDAERWRVSFD